ncbi:MAG TPA: hypothetical protein VMT90_09340 [Dehalococcoidia bacterium]|jgi:hypothetical protein|nr:hypothetical protein [Dehalococcoidia bacterium]
MICHVCESPAVGQCQVCWRFYCREHGEIICETCKEKSPDWQTSHGQSDVALSQAVSVAGPDQPPPTPEQLEEMMRQMGVVRKTILKRVIPVAQTQTIGDTQITLVSLDLYDECFDAHIRLRTLGIGQADPVQRHGMPNMEWEVTDDAGRQYATSFNGGGGSSDEYRYDMTVAPGITDDVQRLDFVINQIEWSTFPFLPNFGRRTITEPGPWRFEVSVN